MGQAEARDIMSRHLIDHGDDFRSEVSMAKHFVANALNRSIDACPREGDLKAATGRPLF